MLKKETLQRMATLAKIKVEDLEAAIKEEKEVDLAIDEKITPYTEEEITTLKSNEYKSGKEKGVEMVVKETKEKLALDFQGKTIDALVDAANKKALADAKIEPEKKVTELQESLKKAQGTVTELEKKLSEKDVEFEGVKVKGDVLQHIPQNATLAGDKIISIMKIDGYDFKREEGKTVVYKDGAKVTDKVGNLVPINEIIAGYVKENKFVPEEKVDPTGRGGGDGKSAAKAAKLSELKKQFTDANKSLQGEEFSKAVQEAAKDKEFDMES